MEWGFVLGLGAITFVVIGLVIYVGRRLSQAVQNRAPDSDLAVNIASTGSALIAGMVGFWVVCLAARVLAPDGSLGAFLGRADGVVAVLVASIFFFAIAAAVLEKLGYPIIERDRHDA